jgi:hypothetical protein
MLVADTDPGVVMFRRPLFASPLRRLEADSRRYLLRQLADYASDADRNDLELLAEASQPGGGEVADILRRQAGARLFRTT